MPQNSASHQLNTSGEIFSYFSLAKSYYGPSFLGCECIEFAIPDDTLWTAVPINSVCLDDDVLFKKGKIRLIPSEKSFMHGELPSFMSEGIAQVFFYTRHFARKLLFHSGSADEGSSFFTRWWSRFSNSRQMSQPLWGSVGRRRLEFFNACGSLLRICPLGLFSARASTENPSTLGARNRPRDWRSAILARQVNSFSPESENGTTLERTEDSSQSPSADKNNPAFLAISRHARSAIFISTVQSQKLISALEAVLFLVHGGKIRTFRRNVEIKNTYNRYLSHDL